MESSKKILIADDDVQMVYILKTIVESIGYKTVSTYSSEEVIPLALSEFPNLIILDIMFAGVGDTPPDGIEISRRLKSEPKLKNIPIIIVSGMGKIIDDEIPFDPEFMPVEEVLDKPVKPSLLIEKIKKYII